MASGGAHRVFGTPVAAVLLAFELLLFEWKPRSFIAIAIAAAVAAAERNLLLTPAPLFPFVAHVSPTIPNFLAWLAVGVLSGLGSGLLTTMVYAAEDSFERLPLHWMWWPLIGGVVVGIGRLIEPSALGVGYDNIRHLLTGDMLPAAVLLLLVVKAVIWSVALGSGTSGGVLAPLLIMGGALGAVAGNVLPDAPTGFWALLGMAAMMGGTMRAPLTACLFAVELTHDVGVLLPLIAACSAAYAVTVLLLKRSILTEKVARRGTHVSREYHVNPYTLARVADVMVREVGARVGGRTVITGYGDEMAEQLIERMVAADLGRVPIVDHATGALIGLVARKDLLQVHARAIADERGRKVMMRWRRRPVTPARAA